MALQFRTKPVQSAPKRRFDAPKQRISALIRSAPKEIMLKVQRLDDFLRSVAVRDPQQPEFMQAVQEVMLSLWP
ncbi:hypothetical protein L7Q78_38895, partial [Achromobacter xylosoxidans]|nr:hypothetical protein [Achromobacter xylosoxidans]